MREIIYNWSLFLSENSKHIRYFRNVCQKGGKQWGTRFQSSRNRAEHRVDFRAPKGFTLPLLPRSDSNEFCEIDFLVWNLRSLGTTIILRISPLQQLVGGEAFAEYLNSDSDAAYLVGLIEEDKAWRLEDIEKALAEETVQKEVTTTPYWWDPWVIVKISNHTSNLQVPDFSKLSSVKLVKCLHSSTNHSRNVDFNGGLDQHVFSNGFKTGLRSSSCHRIQNHWSRVPSLYSALREHTQIMLFGRFS